jgi:hypothetical protein
MGYACSRIAPRLETAQGIVGQTLTISMTAYSNGRFAAALSRSASFPNMPANSLINEYSIRFKGFGGEEGGLTTAA